MATKANLALRKPRNIDRLFRRRINYGFEVRAQLRLRNNLERVLFVRLQSLIRKFIRIQANDLRNNDLTLIRAEKQFHEDLKLVLRKQLKRTLLAIYERNSNVYQNLSKKQDEPTGTSTGAIATVSTGVAVAASDIFDFSNVDFEKLVSGYISNREIMLEGISQTLTKRIQKIIVDGQQEGLGIEAIARKLEKAAPIISRVRAHTIARTEIHTAASWANNKYHKDLNDELDLELMKRWVAVSDGRTRPEHRAANGQKVRMNEKFTLSHPKRGTVLMETAGDSAGGIYHVINCRCVIVYEESE